MIGLLLSMAKKVKKIKNTKEAKLRSTVMQYLRRASLSWEPRNQAVKHARTGRNQYKCNMCLVETFDRKSIKVDHIMPVVPLGGFDSFDGIIRRLFCDVEGFQVLCTPCHDIKTAEEDKFRFVYRNVEPETGDLDV